MAWGLLDEPVQRITQRRAAGIVAELLPLLDGNGPLLDLGCGIGHVGFAVAEATGRDVCYLDIRRYPCTHPKVTLQLYDGRRIPYADNAFESSMAIFMLHHTRDAEGTLRELARVTRRTLVVFEDVLPSRNMLLIQILKDILNNCFFEGPALQHKTEPEWESLFTRLDLTMRKKIHFNKRTWISFEHVGWQLGLPGHPGLY